MKPMGVQPPRSKENDRLKADIWAEQCRQQNKAPTPESVINDQLGAAFPDRPEPGLFDCCICGEPYKLMPGKPIPPLIHAGRYDEFWCEECFREYAAELLLREE